MFRVNFYFEIEAGRKEKWASEQFQGLPIPPGYKYKGLKTYKQKI